MTGRKFYVCLTLLLLIGTQLATSKSVDEKFKDEYNARHLTKRDTNEESIDDEATTMLAATDITTQSADDDTKETSTPMTTKDETTTITSTSVAPEDEETTVKALEDDKPKTPTKSTLMDRMNPEKGKNSSTGPNLLDQPASNLLPPMPINNYLPPGYNGFVPPLPQIPAAFSPWVYPPIPQPNGPYDYPHPSGPAFSDTNVGAFASASANSGPNGVGGTVTTGTSPGGVQTSSFGTPNRGGFPGQSASSFSNSGPFPTGGVQSSHSSSGPGGSFSSSGPQPTGGVQFSQSSSGPGGSFSSSGPRPVGVQPFGSNGPFPGNGVNSVSASSSASGGPGGSFIHASGTFPAQGEPSFIGYRGSFGPDDDDDSVAIEVNGPGASSGIPAYPSSAQNFGYSAPGYAPGFPQNGPYTPSPFINTFPTYTYANPIDFQSLFQQYFAQLQAQQQAFQQQIQAQIQAQQQAGGTFASGGSFITNDRGMVDPNAQVYVNTFSSPNSASASTSIDSRFGYGGSKSSVSAFPFTNKNAPNRIWDQSNRVDSNFNVPNGAPVYGAPQSGAPSNGPQSAFASANLGPQGGYQAGQINPASPGIFSRFGESLPAPSGGQYGVFSSSSSSSSTGPDGKTVSQKSATVGVNDNGKVSYKTVHDP